MQISCLFNNQLGTALPFFKIINNRLNNKRPMKGKFIDLTMANETALPAGRKCNANAKWRATKQQQQQQQQQTTNNVMKP